MTSSEGTGPLARSSCASIFLMDRMGNRFHHLSSCWKCEGASLGYATSSIGVTHRLPESTRSKESAVSNGVRQKTCLRRCKNRRLHSCARSPGHRRTCIRDFTPSCRYDGCPLFAAVRIASIKQTAPRSSFSTKQRAPAWIADRASVPWIDVATTRQPFRLK